jgi:hypothetical protein
MGRDNIFLGFTMPSNKNLAGQKSPKPQAHSHLSKTVARHSAFEAGGTGYKWLRNRNDNRMPDITRIAMPFRALLLEKHQSLS